jgi:nucleoid DNA-binding protein
MTKPELIDELARAAHLTKEVSETVVTRSSSASQQPWSRASGVELHGFASHGPEPEDRGHGERPRPEDPDLRDGPGVAGDAEP